MSEGTTMTRAELRQHLLGSQKGESRIVKLFGAEVELRQPTLEAIMDIKEESSSAQRAADMIIRFAYVPGTNEKVFDEADRDLITKWPFNADVRRLNEAIADLTGVDIEAAAEELKADPLDGQS